LPYDAYAGCMDQTHATSMAKHCVLMIVACIH
jgi:hypothetical protein